MPESSRPVGLYMTKPVLYLEPSASLEDAHRLLEARGVSALAVARAGGRELVGVLSRTDLLRVGAIERGERPGTRLLQLPDRTLDDVMHTDVLTVGSNDTIAVAARKMIAHHVHRVFVVDGGELVGVLSTRDVMEAVAHERVPAPISSLMSSPVITVDFEASVAEALAQLAAADVRGLVVVDQDWPVGLFTQVEALEARALPPETRVEEVMSPAMLCLDVDTPVRRAAAQAAAMDVRRILAVHQRQVEGILTGLDLARAAV